MTTQISPMLAVDDPDAAIEFYERAFHADVAWRIGEPTVVVGLRIDGAEFFLAKQSPPNTQSPNAAGHTTVRIELFVEDPHEVQRRALLAGAIEGSAVLERRHETVGPGPNLRMLQGGVTDPFGHVWLIGKFLD